MNIENIVKDLVKDLATKVFNKSLEKGSEQYEKALVHFELCFSNYLKRSYQRYSTIKTLLYRDRPVSLKDHYVCTDFILGRELINGNKIFESFNSNRKNVVVGTAGSGKSVLLRKLFCDLVEKKQGYIPILIELRLLIKPDVHVSIFDYIFKSLSSLDESLTEEQLHYALKKGKIALLLDGFDEIDYEKKEIYEREILDIANSYSNSIILISSRPDDCFSSWEEFYIYRTMPLSMEQSADLISRIDYDTTVKEKFISEISKSLYEQHKDFLSNPLLLTMMLLTYEQLAEIPEKVHIFYEQAFDTLFHKHDALKSLYKRKSYSSLPIDDFKDIFSAFCIITYTDKKISFSYNEIRKYIEKAILLEGFSVEPKNFFNDLLKSVCIIQKDGNTLTFSHRSFQEYFSAKYLSKSQSLNLGKILDNICTERFSDNVIRYVFELNREKVEKEWILPKLKEILEQSKPLLDKNDIKSYLSLFWDALSPGNMGIGLRLSGKLPNGYFKQIIHNLYPSISIQYFPKRDEPSEEKERLRKGEIENDLYYSITNANRNEIEETPIEVLKSTEWLKQTWVYDGCFRYYNLLTEVYETVNQKYEQKESELSALLFQKK